MTGLIALLGSGEYLDVMDEVDRRLLAESGTAMPRVVCLPTAAGQEGPTSVERWSRLGIEHFRRLEAEVEALPIIDRASAEDPRWAESIRAADLIYFSGGDPGRLYRTLVDTRAWEAVTEACARGAVLAGCSAGAMILGQYLPSRAALSFEFAPGFGWLKRCLVLPHFDRFPFRTLLLPLMRRKLADGQYALGLDENTALVGRIGGVWEVLGASRVSMLTHGSVRKYAAGSRLTLPTW
ncbi:MAG TPA: cyanophycinase [Anaerolineae bacterium]|nr:cyanophycinase [Anaerolineae bacterium]